MSELIIVVLIVLALAGLGIGMQSTPVDHGVQIIWHYAPATPAPSSAPHR